MSALSLAGIGALCTLLSGLVSLLAVRRHPDYLHYGAFFFLCLSGAASLGAGAWALLGDLTVTAELQIGLPWLAWHFRLDPLSGFFLILLGLLVIAVSLYGPSYTLNSPVAQAPNRCRR